MKPENFLWIIMLIGFAVAGIIWVVMRIAHLKSDDGQKYLHEKWFLWPALVFLLGALCFVVWSLPFPLLQH